ncbi:CU044_5270 family protein [Streptacidiphilus sp. MAP5-3]|uniref:CU044_5270 family protein n=1 Tax=unclassified Streptacidiphilus TaxID=2643834 RepID=UPI00351312CC
MDDLTLIGNALAGPEAEPSQAAVEHGRAALLSAAYASVGARDTSFEQPRRPRRWTLRLALTGITAITAAAAVASTVVQPTTAPGPQPPSAAENASTFLSQVSYVQSAQSADWGNAPYWEISTIRVEADGSRVDMQELLAHHAGRTSHLRVTSPLREDKASAGPGQFSIGIRNLTWDQLDALPTDTAALRTLLEKFANPGQDHSEEVFTVIGDLLDSPASPKLRSALYQVAADLPGVRLVGKATDATGRAGMAVERADGKLIVRYIIDPANGQLLETLFTAAQALPALSPSLTRPTAQMDEVAQGRNLSGGRPALRAGAVVERLTFLTVGPADSATG